MGRGVESSTSQDSATLIPLEPSWGRCKNSMTLSISTQIGTVFVGAALAYVMYGINCIQVSWYYRHYPRDKIGTKILVGLIYFLETLQAVLMVPSVWYFLINRGINSTAQQLLHCLPWSFVLPLLPTEISCFLVECFFLMRMWRLTSNKYVTTLAAVPFVAGWTFNIIYIVKRLMRVNQTCIPSILVQHIDRWFFVNYSLRLFSDGVITGTLCYTLWKRRACASTLTNSLQLLRSLIIWTLSTGLFMWLSTLTCIITYIFIRTPLASRGAYFLRGRVYGLAMLALLNHRKRFREIADKSISIQPDVFGTSTSRTNGLTSRTPVPQAA